MSIVIEKYYKNDLTAQDRTANFSHANSIITLGIMIPDKNVIDSEECMTPDTKTDIFAHSSNLLLKAREGDVDAFMELQQNLKNPIYNVCLWKLKDPIESEQITEDTLFELYRNLHKIKEPKAIWAYVKETATNKCFDYIRKIRGIKIIPISPRQGDIDNKDLTAIIPDPDGKSPEKVLIDKEQAIIEEMRLERLREAIARLPNGHHRDVIQFVYLDKKTHKEAAKILGVKEELCRLWGYKARKKLRVLLNETS